MTMTMTMSCCLSFSIGIVARSSFAKVPNPRASVSATQRIIIIPYFVLASRHSTLQSPILVHSTLFTPISKFGEAIYIYVYVAIFSRWHGIRIRIRIRSFDSRATLYATRNLAVFSTITGSALGIRSHITTYNIPTLFTVRVHVRTYTCLREFAVRHRIRITKRLVSNFPFVCAVLCGRFYNETKLYLADRYRFRSFSCRIVILTYKYNTFLRRTKCP